MPTALLRRAGAALLTATRADRTRRDERGQATAEYALVLLGAAAIALLLVSWATKTNVIGRLLDLVFSQVTDRARSGAGIGGGSTPAG
jgi:Flp pilus assembly pilin Flp